VHPDAAPETWDIQTIRRVEARFTGRGGASLFRRSWLPTGPPVRTVALVHGFAEHSARYDAVGAWLASRGAAVHAYDQRGHGRSADRLGRIGDFQGLLDDLDAFLAWTAEEHPGVPRVLLGHSMGGLVVAAHLRERQPDVVAAVLTGPALSISPDVSPWKRRLTGLVGGLLPGLRVRVGIDPEGLCRDPEVVRRYVDDPLVFDHVEAGFVPEMFDAIERTAAGAADVEVPLLVLHGEDDPLCLSEASERFHAGLRSSGSQLRIYPELRHEILNEPEREQVLNDILDWIESREPPSDERA
jgi:alpha-beta hydrolase superfamily lysophospholipase